MNKKGIAWFAELWAYLGMFIILLVFMIIFVVFFKGCSPTLQHIQGNAVTGLDIRHDALTLLKTPVVYDGQNVSVATLISLGTTEGGFDRIIGPLQHALVATGADQSYALRIDYGGRVIDATLDFLNPSDGIPFKLPSPSGAVVDVLVQRASVVEQQRTFRALAKREGVRFVARDGSEWVYWERAPSGASDVWSEEGYPCVTRRVGKARECVVAPSGAPSKCFIGDTSFSQRGEVTDKAACASAMGTSPGASMPDVAAFTAFVREVCRTQEVGVSLKAPDGTRWTYWGRDCFITGPANVEHICDVWSKRDLCEGRAVVDAGTEPPTGMCEGGASLRTLYFNDRRAFVSDLELRGGRACA